MMTVYGYRSKGYGFVSFRTQEAAENGIATMNGKLVGHRYVLTSPHDFSCRTFTCRDDSSTSGSVSLILFNFSTHCISDLHGDVRPPRSRSTVWDKQLGL